MKHIFIRIAIYIPIIFCFYWVLAPNSGPGSYSGPFIAQAAGYITYYGLTYGFWIVIYEAAYHTTKRLWPSKPPDTQPPSVIQQANNPTKPTDKP